MRLGNKSTKRTNSQATPEKLINTLHQEISKIFNLHPPNYACNSRLYASHTVTSTIKNKRHLQYKDASMFWIACLFKKYILFERQLNIMRVFTNSSLIVYKKNFIGQFFLIFERKILQFTSDVDILPTYWLCNAGSWGKTENSMIYPFYISSTWLTLINFFNCCLYSNKAAR